MSHFNVINNTNKDKYLIWSLADAKLTVEDCVILNNDVKYAFYLSNDHQDAGYLIVIHCYTDNSLVTQTRGVVDLSRISTNSFINMNEHLNLGECQTRLFKNDIVNNIIHHSRNNLTFFSSLFENVI